MCLRIRSATMGLNCIARQSIVIAFIWSYLTTKMYENDRRYFLRHVIQRSHAAWKAERQRWRRCVSLKLSCRPTLSTLMHSKRHAIIKSLRPELVVQSTDLWCSALIHMVMMAIRKLSTGAPWTLQVNDKTIIVWLLTIFYVLMKIGKHRIVYEDRPIFFQLYRKSWSLICQTSWTQSVTIIFSFAR